MVQEKISSGSFGVVYLGYDMIKKMDVAIKIEKDDDDLINSLDREVGILTRL
jgi:serine/threonine protein kinase